MAVIAHQGAVSLSPLFFYIFALLRARRQSDATVHAQMPSRPLTGKPLSGYPSQGDPLPGTLRQEPLRMVYFSIPLARLFRRTVYLSSPAAIAIDVPDHNTGKARMQGKERT